MRPTPSACFFFLISRFSYQAVLFLLVICSYGFSARAGADSASDLNNGFTLNNAPTSNNITDSTDIDNNTAGINVVDGIISININNVPLRDVLRVIAGKIGIVIKLSGRLSMPITANLKGVTIDKVLSKVLPEGVGVIYFHRLDQSKKMQIVKVSIFDGKQNNIPETKNVKKTDDRNSMVAEETIKYFNGLHGLADKETVALLSTTLLSSNDENIKIAAVKAIAATSEKENAEVLEKILGDPSANVRIEAMKGLYDLKGEESLPLIGQMLFGDPESSVRDEALKIVKTIDNENSGYFIKAVGSTVRGYKTNDKKDNRG